VLAALYLTYLGVLGGAGIFTLEWLLRLRYGRSVEPFEPGPYRNEVSLESTRLPAEFVIEHVRQPQLSFTSTRSLYGCRHPGPLDSVRLDQGHIRTLFLGDSFTHGWGVADDATFGAIYGRLSGTAPWNLVCGGYGRGTRYHLDQLRRVLRNEPGLEVVLYQLFGNDLTSDFAIGGTSPKPNGTPSDRFPMVKNYVLRPGVNLFRRWSGARRDYASRPEHVYANYGPILREEILTEADRSRRRSDWRLFAESVGEIARVARSANVRVVAFVIPYALRFEPGADESDYVDLTGQVDERSYHDYLDAVRELVLDLGFEYADLEPAFRAAYAAEPRRTLYIPVDLHLNEAGNEVVAAGLASHLASDGTGRP
jgi:lysophospholipase L1-like esterase